MAGEPDFSLCSVLQLHTSCWWLTLQWVRDPCERNYCVAAAALSFLISFSLFFFCFLLFLLARERTRIYVPNISLAQLFGDFYFTNYTIIYRGKLKRWKRKTLLRNVYFRMILNLWYNSAFICLLFTERFFKVIFHLSKENLFKFFTFSLVKWDWIIGDFTTVFCDNSFRWANFRSEQQFLFFDSSKPGGLYYH